MPRKAKSPAAKTKSREMKAKSAAAGGKIRIQYYRSFIATPKTHKTIVRSLGLTKLNQIVERPDNASMRGVVAKVPHLIRIVE
jgi:large subunit ribosomal protein L30